MIFKGGIPTMSTLKSIAKKYSDTSLILRIAIGIVLGAILAVAIPQVSFISIFGDLFVGALKAIAPVLVAVLVMSSLCQGSAKLDSRFGLVIFLYMLTTFLAAFIAVLFSFAFPQTLNLAVESAEQAAPGGLGEVLYNLLMNIIVNPLQATVSANYMGILFWSAILGMALKGIASETTKQFLSDIADAVSQGVRWIINLAPFGICGLVFSTVTDSGFKTFMGYGKLLAVLVGCMLTVSLIINPIIVGFILKANPYPLVWRCLRESGFTAFFTRSSAANIPVNMELCEELGLDKDVYSVSIPLGADTRRRKYRRYQGKLCYSPGSVRSLRSCGLRRIGCCRRIPSADPHGLLPVRNLPGYRNAGRRCRFHYRRCSGQR